MVSKKLTKKIETVKYPSLIEVVFEIKWQLENAPKPEGNNPVLINPYETYDTEFWGIIPSFEKDIKKAGFKFQKTINPPLPHVIRTRYFLSEKDHFPIVQIGQGIFASNADARTYEWNKFKKTALEGLASLVKNYSKSKISPVQIELRYINLFDPKYLSSADSTSFIDFINNESVVKLDMPRFSFSDKLKKHVNGRLIVQNEINNMPDKTNFILDLASVKQDDTIQTVRLESKVVSGDGGKPLPIKGKLTDYTDKWLEDARSILSPFFREFIKDELKLKLEGKAGKKK